jgi:hypothetical protein
MNARASILASQWSEWRQAMSVCNFGRLGSAAIAHFSVGCKRMRAFLILAVLLLCAPAKAGELPDLQQVRSSEDLARFIYAMTTNTVQARDLLCGLGHRGTVQVTPYKTGLPVREIYGTIVEERFGDKLPGFYDQGKRYPVREICSFRDGQGQLRRFHIGIYEEKQYRIMRDFLGRETPNKRGAGKGGFAVLWLIGRSCPALPDRGRWVFTT